MSEKDRILSLGITDGKGNRKPGAGAVETDILTVVIKNALIRTEHLNIHHVFSIRVQGGFKPKINSKRDSLSGAEIN